MKIWENMGKYGKMILILISILFACIGAAEENTTNNATNNATLDPEALKEEAYWKYYLAEKKYDEVEKIGTASAGKNFRVRLYQDLENAAQEFNEGNYKESIRYSEKVIKSADALMESAEPTINIPFMGEVKLYQPAVMSFMLIIGAIICVLILINRYKKIEREKYYKQLSSRTILEKPELLKDFAMDKKSEVRIKASELIKENFDKLPARLRNELVCFLAENDIWAVRRNISEMIIEKFSSLPKKLRESILRKFVNDSKEEVRCNASEIIKWNFDDIPRKLREESIKKLILDNNKTVRGYASGAIRMNIKRIPEGIKETLFKLADDTSWVVRDNIAELLVKDFKNIPKDQREELTRKLINDSQSNVRKRAKQIISKNFNDLPEDLRKYV